MDQVTNAALEKFLAEVLFLLDSLDWAQRCSAVAHTIAGSMAILADIVEFLARPGFPVLR